MRVATNKPGYFGEGSVTVAEPAGPGEGPTHRLAIAKDTLYTQPLEGINTIYDVLEYAVRTHGTKNYVGWRDLIDIVEEEKVVTKVIDGKEVAEKKKWKYFHLSDYKYHCYIEFKEIVSEVARALVEFGITSSDVFNVYSATSPNWQVFAHSCASVSIPIATAYDTLGEDGLAHSLNEPECVGIFTNADLLPTLLKVLAQTPTVRYIVYDGKPKGNIVEELKAVREGIRVLSIVEVREIGKIKPTEPLEARRPKSESLACIMYTSGSTGNPKGVQLLHSNLIASLGGIRKLLGHHLTHDDHFLAYLPLAHVLEYVVELIFLFTGTTIGYGGVKTLTDASVRNCRGDIATFRPSILVGVPAVWETIRKGIIGKVNAGGTIKKAIFNGAMNAVKNNVPVLGPIADSAILSGVRAATGGRLRIALSGGAAVSKETQEFLSVALVTLVQGYGMTESCGMCTVLPPELHQYGVVGLPVPSIEIKFLDAPDAGYTSSQNPPTGEILIRGPSVTQGYYKRPDLNNDPTVFTADGWLRTGDIGRWNKDGTLSIIDRLKNLIKLQSGEYIALERLESVYKACNVVGNLCVYAYPDANQPIAIVIPNENHIRSAIASHCKDVDAGSDMADICTKESVRAMVLKECNSVGKKNAFKPMELLQAVILTPNEWTPENGLVTAAQKIQRAKIAKTFEAEIKAAYGIRT